MNLEESKQYFKYNLKITIVPSKRPLGGQHCGLERRATVLKSEDLEIELSINHFRSNHKNKEYGLMLFDLIIEDLIK
jgi:hypothetical protein